MMGFCSYCGLAFGPGGHACGTAATAPCPRCAELTSENERLKAAIERVRALEYKLFDKPERKFCYGGDCRCSFQYVLVGLGDEGKPEEAK